MKCELKLKWLIYGFLIKLAILVLFFLLFLLVFLFELLVEYLEDDAIKFFGEKESIIFFEKLLKEKNKLNLEDLYIY